MLTLNISYVMLSALPIIIPLLVGAIVGLLIAFKTEIKPSLGSAITIITPIIVLLIILSNISYRVDVSTTDIKNFKVLATENEDYMLLDDDTDTLYHSTIYSYVRFLKCEDTNVLRLDTMKVLYLGLTKDIGISIEANKKTVMILERNDGVVK